MDEEELGIEIFPYKPLTERVDGLNEKEKGWIKSFFKSISYSIVLAEQNDDISIRQAYILLDNAVEQFLKSYLTKNYNLSNFDNEDKIYFNDLISTSKDKFDDVNDLLDKISEQHETRNSLYHTPVYLSVSKKRFFDYVENVFELANTIGFSNTREKVENYIQSFFENIIKKNNQKRLEKIKKIDHLIKSKFDMSINTPRFDILLGSKPGYTKPAFEQIKYLLNNQSNDDKNINVLETIEYVENDCWHHFLISFKKNIWYFFYECFWSKACTEEERHVEEIRNLIENSEHINYEKCYVKENYFEGAIDPYFTSNINDLL